MELKNKASKNQETLYSKKELLEKVGVSERTFANWVFEGVLPPPVLYKGQGGKGFYSERQKEEAFLIKRLNAIYKQSVTEIKTIIQRIKEDIGDHWLYQDDCCLISLKDVINQDQNIEHVIQEIQEFKLKERFIAHTDFGYRFIKSEYHKTRFIERNGEILKKLYDHEFTPEHFFKLKDIGRFYEREVQKSYEFYMRLYETFDDGGGAADKYHPNNMKNWINELSGRQIIELVDEGIMYSPPYIYDDEVYFDEFDLCVAEYLSKICYEFGFGIKNCKKLKHRIEEDINTYFSFPENQDSYSVESILFYKRIKLFGQCIYKLDDTNNSYDERIEGYICFQGDLIKLILEGIVCITQEAIEREIFFKTKPLDLMSSKQISTAMKLGLITKKDINAHLKKRIVFSEKELMKLKILYRALNNQERKK